MPITQLSNTNTDRYPSASIWGNFPMGELLERPGKHIHLFDDFLNPAVLVTDTSVYGLHSFLENSGTIQAAASAPGQGGIYELVSGATDNSGVAMFSNGNALATQVAGTELVHPEITGNQSVFFEARIKVTSAVNTDTGIYIGLAEKGHCINGTSSVGLVDDTALPGSAFDGIGWCCPANGATTSVFTGSWQLGAAALQQNTSTSTTLALSTWAKFGFVVDADAGKIRWYYNGALLSTSTPASATFPAAVYMSPLLYLKTGAGAAKKCQIDWWRVGQVNVT